MAWEFISENSADSGAFAQYQIEKDQEEAKRNEQSKGEAEILGRHLARQANRAAEINAVPAPEIPHGFEQGTGQSVALDQPLPPRNPAPRGLLPLSVPGAKVARGYVDADGNPTPAGEQAFLLMEQGLLDDDAMPTKKAEAFLMDRDVSYLPENFEAFQEREKAGLNREDSGTWAQIFGGLVQTVADAAIASDVLLRKTHLDYFYNVKAPFRGDPTVKDEAEAVLTAMTFAEGSLENSAELGSGMFSTAKRLGAWLAGQDESALRAKQTHLRFKSDMENADLAQYVGGILNSADVMDTLETTQSTAEKRLGPEQAALVARRGKAAGAIVGDPSTLVTMGAGAAIGTFNKGEALMKAAVVADRALVARTTAARLAVDLADTEATLARTATAADIAAQRAADLKGIGQIERASRLEETAKRLTLRTEEGRKAIPQLQEQVKAQALLAENLTTKAGGSEALMEIAEAGRQARALPLEVTGKVLEKIGDGLTKISADAAEFVKKHHLDDFATAAGPVGGWLLGGVQGAAAMAPVGYILGKMGTAKASLAGPFLKQLGTFTRTMGKESLERRGSIPFWQRVANNTELNPVARATAHLADMATLGGRAAVPIRAAQRGVVGGVAALPMNLAFETLAEGGELSPDGLKRAVGSSFVFSGGPAMAGGLVQGTLLARKQKSVGNELNFRAGLGGTDKAVFSGMKAGPRRVIAETAAAFPDLNWKLTDGDRGFYDPRSNTIVAGLNTNRLLEAVLAHEVNHFVTVKGQMESGISGALVGSDGIGGLLRSSDGVLDPDFAAFWESYNKSAEASGLDPLTAEQAAVEFFVDASVQDMLGMVKSGEMQKMAGRSAGSRAVSELSRSLVGRLPLLKDLFYKIGTATDAKGNLVPGTGILADGIREVPGAKEMIRKFIRENAGRKAELKGGRNDSAGEIPIDLAKKSKPLMDAMFSTFETDAVGNVVYDKEGVPRFTPRETIKQRERAGKIITNAIEAKVNIGELPPKGQMRATPEGKWEGEWLPSYALDALAQSGVFNGRQIANLRMFNNSAKRNKGELFHVIYQPATVKRPGKRAAYGTLAPTFRDVVPLGVSISKDGNILLHLFSATGFDRNVNKRAESTRGRDLYQGDVNRIKEDSYAMMEAHKTRGDSLPYFTEKYGAKDARDYQNFINSIFVTDTARQREINPLFDADKINGPKESVYRSYRLDRVNQMTRLQGVPMPFNYEMMRERNLPPGFRFNIAPNGILDPVPAGAPVPPRPAAAINRQFQANP